MIKNKTEQIVIFTAVLNYKNVGKLSVRSNVSANSSITYQIFGHENVFVAQTHGDISFEDLSCHVDELMADPDFYEGMNGFYDFSLTTSLTGNLQAFEKLASDMSDSDVIGKKARTAILIPASNTRLRWMMQGYLLMTSQSLIDYKIFDPQEMEVALDHVQLTRLPG